MIPFLDLKQINSAYQDAAEKASLRVLKSGRYILGPELEMFEKSFAAYCEADHCIGVASGTDAIELILRACDFPKGSEIILPANTYIASVLPLTHLDLIPVLLSLIRLPC